MDFFNTEEHEAASAVAALAYKRERENQEDAGAEGFFSKRPKASGEFETGFLPVPPEPEPQDDPNPQGDENVLKPYPFFFYRDYSRVLDNDPLIPLTPPGRVPNFPAKMQAILSMKELVDVVAWMPHGRSWRVLKPREFEIRVIPRFFEHAKYSSFIRQANGWGFRRITQGRDRNSYYHPLFLRGLPHLCKEMKRPGVSEKQAADPEQEPDFYKISEMYPVPEKQAEDDSVLLHCTLQHGPKARMPIYSGAYKNVNVSLESTKPAASTGLTPRDRDALSAFQQSLGAAESQFRNLSYSTSPSRGSLDFEPIPIHTPPVASFNRDNNTNSNSGQGSGLHFQIGNNKVSALAAANQLAFGANRNPNLLSQAGVAHFAAGFAAAQAISQQQLRTIMMQTQQRSSNEQQPVPRQAFQKDWVFPH